MGFMSWGTLDKGILTGRVSERRKYDASDVRSRAPWWTSADRGPRYKAMEAINPLLRGAGHTGLELALSHVLDYPQTSTALCGVRSVEQLNTACEAVGNLLSGELLGQIRSIASSAG